MKHDLHSCFGQHFTAEVAFSEGQLADAFRLRYRVYCEETGYEDPARFPDGLERDRYDAHAVQMLVRHCATDTVVGAVRLILPCCWATAWSFPFEEVCGRTVLGRPVTETIGRRCEAAEVSRFAVSRNALADIQHGAGRWDGSGESCDDPRRPPQLVSLGLIALLFGVSAEHGINLWYAMMEPSLSRHLSRLGIDFRAIGPPVDHRGKRYPMTADVPDLLDNVAARNPPFRELIDEVRFSVLAQAIAASTEQPDVHPLWVAPDSRYPGGPFVTPPASAGRRRAGGSIEFPWGQSP